MKKIMNITAIVAFLLLAYSLNGSDYIEKILIKKNSNWQYLAKKKKVAERWNSMKYSRKAAELDGWKSGVAGFGYGDDDDKTVLKMRNKYPKVYIRRPFKVEDPENISQLVLMIRYDDAFILYINGKKIMATDNIKEGTKKIVLTERHEVAKKLENFSKFKLPKVELNKGVNFIAIVGINFKEDSSDFSLDPYLIARLKENK